MNNYLNEILDLYERQAQSELRKLNDGNIAPTPEQIAALHRSYIERCEPVYKEMAREKGLQPAPDPVSWADNADLSADIKAASDLLLPKVSLAK
jgi:hypothetical protein